MPKGKYKNRKMPNDKGAMKGGMTGYGTNTGASTGLRKSNEMRSDVMAQPSNKNPYPHGMA